MRRIFVLLLLTVPVCLFGQYTEDELKKLIADSPEDVLLVESSRMLDEGYFSHAEAVVDRLLELNPKNANYNYRKGYILTEGRGQYSQAIDYLEKACMWTVRNYDFFAASEKNAPIDARFYLGKCYHRTGNIEKAGDCYSAFLGQSGGQTMDLMLRSQLAIKQLEVAKKNLRYPKKNVSIINIGNSVNSAYPDYSPVISFDGSALYFTSRRTWSAEPNLTSKYDVSGEPFMEDVYVSYRDFDETWTDPVRMEFCKEDYNEAALSVSNDERRIYVYQDNIGNGDIFFSDFETNRFQEIRTFDNKFVNSEDWETHCFVTPDGRSIYFTSDRPGGYGGRDIYRLVKLPAGNWSQPYNLGPEINSEYDEEAPFMSIDNKTLYFASNGPRSMGGFDLFVTIVDEDNQWSPPVNLGSPMNSVEDDIFYTETIDGRRGYFTSARGDSKGGKDIYEIQNDYMNRLKGSILKGKIVTANGEPIPSDVTVTVATGDLAGTITVYPRIRDGVFMMPVDPCRQYDIVFHRENGGDEFHRQPLNLNCDQQNEEVYREVVLDVSAMSVLAIKDNKPHISEATGTEVAESGTSGVITGNATVTMVEEGANSDKEAPIEALKESKDPIGSKPRRAYKQVKSIDEILNSNPSKEAKETKETKETKGTKVTKETKGTAANQGTTSGTIAYTGPSFKHLFSYNNSRVAADNDSLLAYLKSIDKQLAAGKKVVVEVYASASQVPTTTYCSNQLLAEARADNLYMDLVAYFATSPYKSQLTLKVTSAVVAGPRYQADSRYKEKYLPYQFVELRIH